MQSRRFKDTSVQLNKVAPLFGPKLLSHPVTHRAWTLQLPRTPPLRLPLLLQIW